MAKSQFEKRKSKEVVSKVEETNVVGQDEVVSGVPSPIYTGYDVFQDPETKVYKLVVFEYNPRNGHCMMKVTKDVTRVVALTHDVKKTALKMLLK